MTMPELINSRGTETRGAEAYGEQLWFYLIGLRGQLYAIPDNSTAVLLPHIGPVPQVTPLPRGLTQPWVRGLVNVNQRAEVLIDLGLFLSLAGDPAPQDRQRIIVIGEEMSGREGTRQVPYRLAFAVDGGYELITVAGHSSRTSNRDKLDGYVQTIIETSRGPAHLLAMEAICATIVRELGTERGWNVAAQAERGPALVGVAE